MKKVVSLIFVLLLCCGCGSNKLNEDAPLPTNDTHNIPNLKDGDIIKEEADIGQTISWENVKLYCFTPLDTETDIQENFEIYFSNVGIIKEMCYTLTDESGMHYNCLQPEDDDILSYDTAKQYYEDLNYICSAIYYTPKNKND